MDHAPAAAAPYPAEAEFLFNERAAIAEYEGKIPREWAEGFARLQVMPKPQDMPPRRWAQMLEDCARFLDRWAPKLAGLGWTTLDVFGADPKEPWHRIDKAGLLWLLNGATIIFAAPDQVRLRLPSGSVQTYYRSRRPGAVAAWELRGAVR